MFFIKNIKFINLFNHYIFNNLLNHYIFNNLFNHYISCYLMRETIIYLDNSFIMLADA